MPVLLVMGLATVFLGLVLFFAWFGHILALIKAVLPIGFIVCGAVAAYLGWEEKKERERPAMDFSTPDEASRYQAEARAYQERINEIKVTGAAVIEVNPEDRGSGDQENKENNQ